LQLRSFENITTTSRHIFLSPHFDDVVFSCGGTVAVQVSNGLHPLVITIFGGIPPQGWESSPYAYEVQREMGVTIADPGAFVAKRRREDATAMDYLQADYLWLDYFDAIYRGNPAYYTRRDELIGGEVHSGDTSIERQLAQDLVALHSRLPDTVWYAPLSIGRHVDHQIVASAADHLIQRGANVKFYEDFPYVLQQGALEARIKDLGGAMEPAYVEMSEMLPIRLEAADFYTSQIQVNFGDRVRMHKAMENYTHGIRPVQTVHLERYWTTR